MYCFTATPDLHAAVPISSCSEIQHNMDCIKTEPDPDAEVYLASCGEIQHNMDCIKTEPDPVAEVYSASCCEIQLVDIKQEEQPVSIKDGNDVSCQCVCC
jgi:hypothetical protein